MNDGQEDSAFCGGTKLPSNEDKLTNENDLIETVTDQQMTTDGNFKFGKRILGWANSF